MERIESNQYTKNRNGNKFQKVFHRIKRLLISIGYVLFVEAKYRYEDYDLKEK